MLVGKTILLIISGGIAAYKGPDLVRRLRERGARVRCLLTEGGRQFVTPLALSAVSEEKVFQGLFSLTDENEMSHIRLSRETDLLLVAPATANILAKMAHGQADNLATTVLLATDKPVIVAPAMNVQMWQHTATCANIETLAARGVIFIGPESGNTACGEIGPGRMSEPTEIVDALETFFRRDAPLDGFRVLVTGGPTYEAIDPVRYLANRSSGKQGYAIADAMARLGSETILVSGPTQLPDPPGVKVIHVESACEMMAACEQALPADVAVCAAAVADWRAIDVAPEKIKKEPGKATPELRLTVNPDILSRLSKHGNQRPRLVIGFAAETENVVKNAVTKRLRKGCDWMVANDVSPGSGTFGGDTSTVHLITPDGIEDWPESSKKVVGERLADRLAAALGGSDG